MFEESSWTGRIESFGSGFRRAFEACKEENVRYDYKNTKSGFRFIFYRTHGYLNVREMSKAEEMVLEQIRENGFALRGKSRRKSGIQTKQSIEQLKS